MTRRNTKNYNLSDILDNYAKHLKSENQRYDNGGESNTFHGDRSKLPNDFPNNNMPQGTRDQDESKGIQDESEPKGS